MYTTTDFVRKTKAVTLACKTAVFLTEGNVQVDPQLLFQRLSFEATGGQSDIIAAGEKSLVTLYKGGSEEGLDLLRYSRFRQKITTGTSFVQPDCLPLASATAVYHSLRVYHLVQQWRGVAFPPQDWGWKQVNERLLPVRTDLKAAHVSLLEIVKCNCKSNCGFQRCSCKKKTWTGLLGCMCDLQRTEWYEFRLTRSRVMSRIERSYENCEIYDNLQYH